MTRIAMGTLLAVTLAGCSHAPQAAILPPVQPAAQAVSRPAPAATASATDGGRWGINDGIRLTEREQQVFDALPGALKPTPGGSPAYVNWISNFAVRPGSGQADFLSFSGVRLIMTSQFVHTRPNIETFFTGVYEVKTGKVSVYRESTLSAR